MTYLYKFCLANIFLFISQLEYRTGWKGRHCVSVSSVTLNAIKDEHIEDM